MENPVLFKELRSRIRSRKSRGVLLAVGIPALLLAVFCYVRLLVAMAQLHDDEGNIWIIASLMQLGFFCLLVPGLLSNAISQEKEQRTWGLLLITRLTHSEILTGKLIARLLVIPILILVFLPFMAHSAVASNIRASVILSTYLALLSTGLFFGIQALFWSWLFRRTALATAAAYGTVFFFTVGTFILDGLIWSVSRGGDPVFLRVNPFFALGAYLEDALNGGLRHESVALVPVLATVYLALSALMLVMMSNLERVGSE